MNSRPVTQVNAFRFHVLGEPSAEWRSLDLTRSVTSVELQDLGKRRRAWDVWRRDEKKATRTERGKPGAMVKR